MLTSIFIILGLVWTFVGAIFYVFTFPNVHKKPQEFVLALMGGPIIWLILLSSIPVGFIADKIIVPFSNWLTERN